MPVKSAKQFRFMQAAASGNLRGVGSDMKETVAKKFLKETPHKTKSKFASMKRKNDE